MGDIGTGRTFLGGLHRREADGLLSALGLLASGAGPSIGGAG